VVTFNALRYWCEKDSRHDGPKWWGASGPTAQAGSLRGKEGGTPTKTIVVGGRSTRRKGNHKDQTQPMMVRKHEEIYQKTMRLKRKGGKEMAAQRPQMIACGEDVGMNNTFASGKEITPSNRQRKRCTESGEP